MNVAIQPADNRLVEPLRTRYRAEMNCQIVHDSIHRREGWVHSYLICVNGVSAGFGSFAVGGPWKEKPAVYEFFLLPAFRARAFALFESFLAVERPGFFEIQSNDLLLSALALARARDIATEKIVFRDHETTRHPSPAPGVRFRCRTDLKEIREAIAQRQGGGEWSLELEDREIAKGGILFHYNRPYTDLYMEVEEPHRRRGFGRFLIQELKRASYELGAIPCARCSPENIASRQSLQSAGFAPFAHILHGVLP